MTSQALQDFQDRLAEVEQLVEAHGAMVRLRKAERLLRDGGQELSNIGRVIDALVAAPGPGRPYQVQALNSAAIALLSGHLQGYICEVFEETARALLAAHVVDVDVVIESAPTKGNPNEQNINMLFGTIGFPKILADISWRRMGNDALRKKLREFNELRNRVVHGQSETVSKAKVENYVSVWRNFAQRFDRKVAREMKKKGVSWP